VTRKITVSSGKILKDPNEKLYLGNIYSLKDWGQARDYIQGMWLMLQQDKPEDYLLSTNESHSVKEFVEKAFVVKGFDIKWKGDVNTGRELIFIKDKYFSRSFNWRLYKSENRTRLESKSHF
jgi:GDPmannose 4,6-dehydratase